MANRAVRLLRIYIQSKRGSIKKTNIMNDFGIGAHTFANDRGDINAALSDEYTGEYMEYSRKNNEYYLDRNGDDFATNSPEVRLDEAESFFVLKLLQKSGILEAADYKGFEQKLLKHLKKENLDMVKQALARDTTSINTGRVHLKIIGDLLQSCHKEEFITIRRNSLHEVTYAPYCMCLYQGHLCLVAWKERIGNANTDDVELISLAKIQSFKATGKPFILGRRVGVCIEKFMKRLEKQEIIYESEE